MERVGFLLLCGGQSRRMKQCKALLDVGGVTMLERIARCGESFEERIISVNDPQIPTPDGFVRCGDVHPGFGPMAGLHAALSMTQCDALVCAPCDAPYYSGELARYLADQFDSSLDALIMQEASGRDQPLMGVYAKRLAPVFEAHILSGRCKLMGLLDSVKMKRIILPAGFDPRVFSNINTPQEYASLKGEN